MFFDGNDRLTKFQKFWINVLKQGPVPNHVAIITDGNRRYARRLKIPIPEGHKQGFEKLIECFRWCRELGINELTVYALSIDNLKRPDNEKYDLLSLFEEKFLGLFEEQDYLKKEDIAIRIVGNFPLLTEKIRSVVQSTSLFDNNNKFTLNFLFCYKSTDEITQSIGTIVKGVEDGNIESHDISEELISRCLYTNLRTVPDILIRTSGEVRLSDFLLWQMSKTKIFFSDSMWPEFSIWSFLSLIFKYQRLTGYNKLHSVDIQAPTKFNNTKIDIFIEKLKNERKKQVMV